MAANADIGQAKAAYFPTLKLTAGAGNESLSMATLFDSGSRFWNLGLGLTQPIFRAGALDAVVSGAEARQAAGVGPVCASRASRLPRRA